MSYFPVILSGDYSNLGDERQSQAVDKACVCVLEIHFNSFTDASVRGAEISYQTNDQSAASKALADSVWASLSSIGLPAHGVPVKSTSELPRSGWIDYYAMPTVVIEALFISNVAQSAWLHDSDNESNLADAIVAGVQAQFASGVIGLSPGHVGKTSSPTDPGADCAQGDHEADHTLHLANLLKTKFSNLLLEPRKVEQ